MHIGRNVWVGGGAIVLPGVSIGDDAASSSLKGRCEQSFEVEALIEEIRFAVDSPLEGDGFEPSVPRKRDLLFKSAFNGCA